MTPLIQIYALPNENVQSSDTFWGRWAHNVCAQINVIKTNNIDGLYPSNDNTVAIVRTFLLFLRCSQ